MSPIAVASIAFFLILASMLAGTLLRKRLPEHHLAGDSKDVMKLATALIATMSALVLALLFASTRTSFEHNSAAISRMTADVAELDQLLTQYGPEARPIRVALRSEIRPLIDSIWRDDAPPGAIVALQVDHSESVVNLLRALTPKTPTQNSIQTRALQVSSDLLQTHLSVFAQPADSISLTFIIVLVFWLMFIFASFSLSAPPNPTLFTVLFVCIVSASAAIYLILELGLPFGGLMQVSPDGLRHALAPLPAGA